MTNQDIFDIPQGTLDLLIMRVVALGPIHGYAIAQRIQQMSQSFELNCAMTSAHVQSRPKLP